MAVKVSKVTWIRFKKLERRPREIKKWYQRIQRREDIRTLNIKNGGGTGIKGGRGKERRMEKMNYDTL